MIEKNKMRGEKLVHSFDFSVYISTCIKARDKVKL